MMEILSFEEGNRIKDIRRKQNQRYIRNLFRLKKI